MKEQNRGSNAKYEVNVLRKELNLKIDSESIYDLFGKVQNGETTSTLSSSTYLDTDVLVLWDDTHVNSHLFANENIRFVAVVK